MERTVSIAGHRDDLEKGLKGMLEELEQGGSASWQVTGNGASTPDLNIELTVEPHEEFTEPVVDYQNE